MPKAIPRSGGGVSSRKPAAGTQRIVSDRRKCALRGGALAEARAELLSSTRPD